MKHDITTHELHLGLSHTNDNLKDCLEKGAKNIKEMEKHTKILAL
jgi:hypothetical protein